MEYLSLVLDMFRKIPLQYLLASVFGFAMLLEFLASKIKSRKIYNRRDSLDNISIGLISFLIDFAFSLASYAILFFIYKHMSMFEVKLYGWACFLLLFILIDFEEYWFHRLSHHVNMLWKAHMVHHQSTHFNLTVGLRTSFFVPLFNFVFYVPFVLLGFHPDHIMLVIMLQGAYQLLLHTEMVRKLGWIEKLLITPSAHRVHHGQNDLYIDKNFGKVLVVWDRMFGTYEEETETVVYGVVNGSRASDLSPLRAICEPIHQLCMNWIHEKDKQRRKALLLGTPHDKEDTY